MAPGLLRLPSEDSVGDNHGLKLLEPLKAELLSSTLETSPSTFLKSPHLLQHVALAFAKQVLDPIIHSTCDVQAARIQSAQRKRKRGQSVDHSDVLGLRELHVNDFQVDQVWEQVRRVLDVSRKENERAISIWTTANPRRAEHGTSIKPDDKFQEAHDDEDSKRDATRSDISTSEEDGDEFSEDRLSYSHDEDRRQNEGATVDNEDVQSAEDIEEGAEDLHSLDSFSDHDSIERSRELASRLLVKDKHGLNDGFFSIDEFNRTSELFEQEDAGGEGDVSKEDDEAIDWDTDPLLAQTKWMEQNPMADEADTGPTFSDVDLEGDSSEEDADESSFQLEDGNGGNTNDIKYEDFFAPPARPLHKVQDARSRRPTKSQHESMAIDDEARMKRTIDAVHRDLFEDELSNHSDGSDHRSEPMSSHEKRRSALKAQILALEAASVAKRDWKLSGEARAIERPINSLLEEDLEFERAGKPVPVITAAVSEEIEALIKRRILAQEFDEVPKRMPEPGALTAPEARRGRLELDDKKSGVGLADLYEDERLRATDPGYVDKRDASLKAQHEAIENAWKHVSVKLDALSSWHFRPKPPDVSVKTIEDVARITMEDPRPAGVVGILNDEGRLAPQEIFRVGDKETREEGVVVGGVGGLVAKQEMSREQKLRRRRRDKERMRKAGAARIQPQNAKEMIQRSKKPKQDVLDDLEKAAVKVIGKSGELQTMKGRKVQSRDLSSSGGRFKL